MLACLPFVRGHPHPPALLQTHRMWGPGRPQGPGEGLAKGLAILHLQEMLIIKPPTWEEGE